jgi:hypothetical protein
MSSKSAPHRIEPRAERSIRRIIPAGEQLLWAAHSSGPTWRQRYFFLINAMLAAGIPLMPFLLTQAFLVLAMPFGAAIVWWLAG